MTSLHLRRGLAAAVSAMIALALLAPAATLAAQPGWRFDLQKKLPDSVSPGSLAGYSFRIVNDGPSNISQLYLTSSVSGAAAYVTTTQGTCATSPKLFCTFGALGDDQYIDLVVAYTTPTTGNAFNVTFQINTTGASSNDQGHNSHGDTKDQAFSTGLSSDKNFVGGFSLTGAALNDDANLGPKNIQSGKVTPPALNVGISLQDGLADNAFSCAGQGECAHRFGEWTRLDVNKGQTFANGIKVEITILGSKVPNGASLANIDVIHVLDNGTANTIETRCDGVTTLDAVAGGAECVTAVKVGNNVQVTFYAANNGGNRLSY